METFQKVPVYSASMPEVRTNMRDGVHRALFFRLVMFDTRYDFRLKRLFEI